MNLYIRKGRVVYDWLVSLVGSPAGLYSYDNFITYTEYDAKPPEPIVKENGKPGLDRGRQQWKYLLFARSLFNFCPPC